MSFIPINVLFVSSGNSYFGVSPIVKNQGNSLLSVNCNVDYYLIKGKGIIGYLKHLILLRRYLSKHQYNLIHAHYSLSAFVASLSGAKPLVVSLMGSDINNNFISRFLVKIFVRIFKWKALIVKSEKMLFDFKKVCPTFVIPNGVDIDVFSPRNRDECCKILSWNPNQIHVLFAADPRRKEKNFMLASSAFKLLDEINVVLHSLKDVSHVDVPIWYNASDVVILSSLSEGSPNVIKEAMACNKPIVATDVGDIQTLFGNEPGHFLSNLTLDDYLNNLKQAIFFSKKYLSTNGRNRIIKLGLDNFSVANKIVDVYNKVLTSNILD